MTSTSCPRFAGVIEKPRPPSTSSGTPPDASRKERVEPPSVPASGPASAPASSWLPASLGPLAAAPLHAASKRQRSDDRSLTAPTLSERRRWVHGRFRPIYGRRRGRR